MKRYVIAALVMLGMGVRAEAKLAKGDQLLAAQLGIAVPISELDYRGVADESTHEVFADPGGTFGIQYLYQVLPVLGFGLELSQSNYSERTSYDLFSRTVTESDGDSLDILAVARGSFIPNSRVHPFVEGGLGISRTALKIQATPQLGYLWADSGTRERRTVIDSSETGAAIMIGGGVDFFVTQRFFIGGGSRFLIYTNRDYDPTAAGTQSGFNSLDATLASFNTSFRAGFKF